MENVKFKETLQFLKKESRDFQKYNKLLSEAIDHINDSNDKLLFSFHDRYSFFADLERKNQQTELNTQMKIQEIQDLDLANDKLEQFVTPEDEMLPDEMVTPMIRYSEVVLKSMAVQLCIKMGDFGTFESMQQKESQLSELNNKLKAELSSLNKQIGHNDIFGKYLAESNLCLTLSKELRDLENKRYEIEPELVLPPRVFLNALDMPAKDSTTVSDISSYIDSEFSRMDIVVKKKKEVVPKRDRICQTNDNMRTREISRNFSKEIKQDLIEKQNQKIEEQKLIINHIVSEISSVRKEVEKTILRKSQIPTNLIEQHSEGDNNINIFLEYNRCDKEVETEEQHNYDQIMELIDSGYSKTIENLRVSNEKAHIDSIFEQKVLEMKLVEMANERKTADYKSLLKQLKLTNPSGYSKEIGTNVQINPVYDQKKKRYQLRIGRINEKIKRLNEESIENELKEKQTEIRIEILKRELILRKEPKYHTKSQLTELCQQIAANQEEIREKMREVAFLKLEIDFVQRMKDHICRETAQKDELGFKIREMLQKLKRMKLRYNFILNAKFDFVRTAQWEIDDLESRLEESGKHMKVSELKTDKAVQRSLSVIKSLKSLKMNLPLLPSTCETLQSEMKSVM